MQHVPLFLRIGFIDEPNSNPFYENHVLPCVHSSVRPSMTQYERLNSLPDFHEIRYISYLQIIVDWVWVSAKQGQWQSWSTE